MAQTDYGTAESFHLGDVLSITTGLLVSPDHMGGVNRILQHMVGEPLWTHQLPRASDECRPSLLAQHPDLADVEVPDAFDCKEHVERWLAEQVQRYGERRDVRPLAPQEHTSINPISELLMLKPDAQVVVVEVDGAL